MQLTLIVLDVNDNTPVFAEDLISITVTEGESLDQTLLQVSASDADSGNNAEIFYSLDGDDGNANMCTAAADHSCHFL